MAKGKFKVTLGAQGWHSISNFPPDRVKNVHATTLGYNQHSHNGHKGGDDAEYTQLISDPYTTMRGMFFATSQLKGKQINQSRPEVWNWYSKMSEQKSYELKKE